jgi:hypothetical protein
MWKTNSLNSTVCYSKNLCTLPQKNCTMLRVLCQLFYMPKVLHCTYRVKYCTSFWEFWILLPNQSSTNPSSKFVSKWAPHCWPYKDMSNYKFSYHHGDLVMGWLFSDVSPFLWSSVCCQLSIYHVVYIHQLPWIQNNLQVFQSLFSIIPTTACSKSDLNVWL